MLESQTASLIRQVNSLYSGTLPQLVLKHETSNEPSKSMGNYTLPLPLQAIKVGFDTNLPKARWYHISRCGFLDVVPTPSFLVHKRAHTSDTACVSVPFHLVSFTMNVRTALLILPAFQQPLHSLSSATTKVLKPPLKNVWVLCLHFA